MFGSVLELIAQPDAVALNIQHDAARGLPGQPPSPTGNRIAPSLQIEARFRELADGNGTPRLYLADSVGFQPSIYLATINPRTAADIS